MTENVRLVCATSNVDMSNPITWKYQSDIEASKENKVGNFDAMYGTNELIADKPGYYHCEVRDHNGALMNYSVGLLALSKDTVLSKYDR